VKLFFTIVFIAQVARGVDACAFVDRFASVHETIRALVRNVDDTADLVKRLNRTSRSRPYKRVETTIAEVRSRAKAQLEALSDIVIGLDSAPDTESKRDAMSLAAADWNAVDLVSDYAGIVLLNEREENLVSMNTSSKWLTFGVNKNSPQTAGDNYARDQLEGKINEPREALRLPELPTVRYERRCGSFTQVPRRQAREPKAGVR
jgi:hypothetical protein